MRSHPKSIPPRCAKCATLPPMPKIPVNSSITANMTTNHLAFRATGGKIRVRTESGEKEVPVVYSLGNIISNMSATGTQAGLLLKMTAVKHPGGGTEILPLEFRYTWCSLPGRLTDSHKTIFIEDGLHRRKEWQNPYDHTKMKDTYCRIKRETGISDEKDNKTGSD